MDNKISMILLKVATLLLAIYMIWGFWMFFIEGILLVLPFMLGYIYILIGLAKWRRWAVTIFLTNITISTLIWIMYISFIGPGINIRTCLDFLTAIFAWISAITMIVGVVSWFMRKIFTKRDISEKQS